MKNNKILILGFFAYLWLMSACEEDTISIQEAPSIDFTFSPEQPVDGEQIFFSPQTENESEIVSWHWNFGDAQNSTADVMAPTFSYPVGGNYEVSLTVRDAAGNFSKIYKNVHVTLKEIPAEIAWEFTTNNAVRSINDGSSAPAIADDGTIYYVESRATSASSVVAVTDLGTSAELKWTSNAVGGELPNAPSIGPDGNIFINAWVDDKAISKLNAADGSIIWSGPIGTDVSNNTSAVDSEGNSYHGSRSQGSNGGIFSWSPTGDLRWSITSIGSFYAAPVLSSDESTAYYLNTSTGKIWAINTADGTEKWEEPVGLDAGRHGSSLSVSADGTIYFTTKTHVAAVTDQGTTGSVKWSTEVNDAAQSGVVIGPDGKLYTGSSGGLVSLNPEDGSINWINESFSVNESVPAVDADGRIYVGSTDGRLIIVHPYGEVLKEFEIGDGVVNSPTIADDGSVYVEAMSNSKIKLVKITVKENSPADSAWPMKGQNRKNSGVIPN